jgi:hypothetical protein
MYRYLTCALALTAAAIALTPGLAAQAKPKARADAPKTYNVQFVFNETTYSGTMTLSVAKGAVSGPMVIDQPVSVTGDTAGTLKGDSLMLDYEFTIKSDQPCTGRVTVDAKMTPDGSASGTAHSTGCSDAPLDGTFALKVAPAK